MTANELMLDNYVFENYSGIMIVKRIFEDELYLKNANKDFKAIGSYSIEAINPIPLTEDWLQKFGFIIRDKTYSLNYGGESRRYALLEKYSGNNSFILYFHERFGETLFNINDGFKRGDHAIKYVHQLQNLFFALTNNELILI